MKIHTQVHCSTISQLPRSVKIMKSFGWELVDASRSDFIFHFATDSVEATDIPPILSFAELEKLAETKKETQKDQS